MRRKEIEARKGREAAARARDGLGFHAGVEQGKGKRGGGRKEGAGEEADRWAPRGSEREGEMRRGRASAAACWVGELLGRASEGAGRGRGNGGSWAGRKRGGRGGPRGRAGRPGLKGLGVGGLAGRASVAFGP